MKWFLVLLTLIPPVSAADAARIIHAGGSWAAIDFGSRCEARARALWSSANSKAVTGFAFDRAGPRQGQFYARLSRPARAGASVVATIGSEPFLLIGRGEWAWSRNMRQQHAMLDAARAGRSMRIESRDRSGRRIVDRYALAGAPTAIDSAAASCARAGKRT